MSRRSMRVPPPGGHRVWLLDAESASGGPYTFYALTTKGEVDKEVSHVGTRPPNNELCDGIYHQGGQAIVEREWARWKPLLRRMRLYDRTEAEP